MTAKGPRHFGLKPDGRGVLSASLLLAILLFVWIGLNPFPSLMVIYADQNDGAVSNPINQLIALGLLFGAVVFATYVKRWEMIARPRLILLLIFSWNAFASLASPDPTSSLKRLAMSAIIIVVASIAVHLPKDERQFAKLLAIVVGITLALSYCGVVFMPERAVHQATDYLEPMLAGDWRGVFSHKNAAAATTSLCVIIGLYLTHTWSRWGGALVVLLSVIFLYNAGGKTSMGVLPLTLAIVWAMERWPRGRSTIVYGGLTIFAASTLGVALSPGLSLWADAQGFDATFTGRADIWRLAFSSIAANPIFGYGYQAFWQSNDLLGQFQEVPNWAVGAVDAHNGYLDVALNSGAPGLLLLMIWVIVQPLRDLARADATRQLPLTRLFTRIWIFVLLTACLESALLTTGGPVWFMMLVALFGLNLQGSGKVQLVGAWNHKVTLQ